MRTIVVNAENPGGRSPDVNATIDNRNSFTRAGVDVDEVHARANSNLADVWEKLAPGHGSIYTSLTMAQLGVGFRALEAGGKLAEVRPIIVLSLIHISEPTRRTQ